MDVRTTTSIGLALVGLICLAGVSVSDSRVEEVEIVGPNGSRVDEGGEPCTTGCKAAKHAPDPLSADELNDTLLTYAGDPVDAPERALETLLFHGAQTRAWLETAKAETLPPAHREFLERELDKRHATVHLRLVDHEGMTYADSGPKRVPLDVKQHLRASAPGFGHLEFNGTVRRVGLYHLWSRY